MAKKTFIEKASANLATNTAMTLLAASTGGFWAPLVPMLTRTLANGRFQKRLEAELQDINQRMSDHEADLRKIDDNQFKLINELILTVITTANEDKINYLKTAIINTIGLKDIEEHECAVISRILRDISVLEMRLLIKIKDYNEVYIQSSDVIVRPDDACKYYILSDADEAALFSGLINQGLVAPKASDSNNRIKYFINPIGRKVADLVFAK